MFFGYGLDDYVIKGLFTENCIKYRVLKLLNYNYNKILNINSFNNIYLDIRKREMYIGGVKIPLTPLETEFLKYTIENKGYCEIEFLKSYLTIFLEREFPKHSIVMLVSRLRKKIRYIYGYSIIKNKYSRGYYLDN
jgi:DNA-binding response OmpR family regulator